MRSISLSVFFSFVALIGLGQGIKFEEGNLAQLLNLARQQNKLLMVEIYLNGCPHCAALAPVLQEKKVGDFFNTAFVNAKIEANSATSKELQMQKGLTYPEFPLFFFFDANGQLVHQAAPAERPNRTEFINEVIKHGNEALTPTLRTSNYASRYTKGERALDFLVNYGKYAKATKDNSRLTEIGSEIAKAFTKPADLESPTGFYIISRLINDFQNPMAKHFFANLPKYKKYNNAENPKAVDDAVDGIIYTTLYGPRANKLSSKEIVAMREAMIKAGTPAKVVAPRTLLKELEAYLREKNTPAATARLNEYRKLVPLQFLDYSYLVRFFNEKATDNSYVPSLITWVNDGVKTFKPTDPNHTKKALADLHAEKAKAYLRVGNKVESKKAAQEAFTIAKAANEDTKAYTELLK
ncbi:MAG: thioredoxin family protein [Spirosomataceae bacterium]